ncbi:MAG: acetyl-CoA carboxylase biotin carboxyl carrier protein [Leptolyngbyaceae bacterium]|nr:acetyl-CoA carboxylase biotin carboxyl carrier protein [Leptolyngbyaceae bacterium]
MELNFNEIQELLTTLGKTDIEELTLKSNDFELTVRKTHAQSSVSLAPTAVMPTDPATLGLPQHSAAVPSVTSAALPVTGPPSTGADSKLLEITSPMVGTFYRAPAPDEAPFVSVGDRISTGQTVCIIEAMKLMNELEAEFSGEIVEILAENSEPVEFGQVLMRVKPVS